MGYSHTLSIKNVSVSFGSKHILDDISLDVRPGEVAALIGPSGAGKTTLMKCAYGEVKYSGEILIDGVAPDLALKRKDVGFGFQEPVLLKWLNVLQNVTLPSQIGIATYNKELKERAELLLSNIGLGKVLYHFPDQLSGGQRKRVSVAQALVLNPKLVLLDEPSSQLDYVTRLLLIMEYEKLIRCNKNTALIITHDIEEACYVADTIYITSSTPAKIIKKIELSYNQQRDATLLDNPKFLHAVSECRKIILHEQIQ